MKLRHSVAAIGLALGLLAGCGGGGDDAGSTLPRVVQDIAPSGERVDLRSQNYFVMAAGDHWTYDHVVSGSVTGTATRQVTGVSGNEATVVDTDLGMSSTSVYRHDSRGVWAVNPLGTELGQAAANLVGDLLMFPEPFYTGGAWQQIRQGGLGMDLDGDGKEDSFRLDLTQTYLGQSAYTLPDGSSTQVAGFRSVMVVTVTTTSGRVPDVTVTATEDSRWAPNLGMVQASYSVVDSSDVTHIAPYTLRLRAANVGGVERFSGS